MEHKYATEVTRLLQEWKGGDAKALDALLPLVYKELRCLARSQLRKERRTLDLNPPPTGETVASHPFRDRGNDIDPDIPSSGDHKRVPAVVIECVEAAILAAFLRHLRAGFVFSQAVDVI